MRFFSSTLAALAILTVALFGALVFLVSSGLSPDDPEESVLGGPLGIAEESSAEPTFPPMQEYDPNAPLPKAVYQSAWYLAEGYVKVLAIDDLRDFNDDRVVVLDASRRRVFEKESVTYVDPDSVTIGELGRQARAAGDEKLVLVGPVEKVNGERVRQVIQLTEVTAAS